ncbi:MAG: site-specific DNA-methyltransferase [Pirellulales bacterium]|nr:site-specific DNA-methyltransferase [Pirellulales bacterium]
MDRSKQGASRHRRSFLPAKHDGTACSAAVSCYDRRNGLAVEPPQRQDSRRNAALAPQLNAIHNRDCFAGLRKLDEGSVHLAFADPPFNIGYDYDVYRDSLESQKYLQWSRQWTAEVVRALKPDGTFWLAIGDEYAAELKVMLQQEHELTCRSWVIWYYTFGVNCKYKFSRSHAHLFHMVKDPDKFTFNIDAIRVPSARQLVYGDRRANPTGRLPDDTWILRPQDLPEGFQPDGDTWYFPRVCGTFKERTGWHGCQMPEQLLGRIIRACSNEGDLVLDPFAGSGTTLAVAKKLKRRFLGFELSAEYAQQARKRLARISPGDPLDGAPEPLVSAPDTANGRRLKDLKPAAGRKRRNRDADPQQQCLPNLFPDGP